MNTLPTIARPSTPVATAHSPTGPSPINPAAPARLLPSARGFADFGRWTQSVTVARQGTLWRLADWIAVNQRPGASRESLWRECQAANPHCFKTYAVISLARRSFFLPAGEVVFEATANPTQIPQSPPQGVLLRHLEAMDAHPEAAFYYLEPVFTSEPTLRLYPADELRAEAAGDLADAFMLARNYGWLFRSADWSRRQGRRLAAAAASLGERIEEGLNDLRDQVLPSSARLADLQRRYDRALRFDQHDEAARLRSSIRRVEWHMTFDPILCFELPDDPGRLRFEAHWYVGTDGRTYVHY